MLNPKSNRLNYGSILSPPNNYQLDFAIGTTYSLDLDALVGSSISLGLSQETDSTLMENPIFLLEALRGTSDKLALFCENGRISLPNKPTSLYILLEDMIFEVNNPKFDSNDNDFSFHPKFWLLRFIDDEDNVMYRLVVLSRNLTFDRSWDITFTMDGFLEDKKIDKNKPISKFIEYLINYSTNESKTYKMRKIVEELDFIQFDLDSKIFDDFDFIVNGIGEKQFSMQENAVCTEKWDELFIMSPFLSTTVIRDFNNRQNKDSKGILITRANSLGKLNSVDCSNFEVYRLRDELIDGESAISGETRNMLTHDIHAKIYLIEYDENVELYLGSLNASHNALFGNIEFMIKLKAKKNKFNMVNLMEDIFNGEKGGKDCPFQLVDIENIIYESVDPEGQNLDLIIKRIIKLNIKANVTSNGDLYDINLTVDNFDENKFKDYEINIKPLLSGQNVKFSKNMTFEKISKIDISEFFKLTICDKEHTKKALIKIPITGMPENRQNEVISSIIDDETAFVKYVAFLLGDDYVLIPSNPGHNGNSNDPKGIGQLKPELYEKMLRAAQSNPKKLENVGFLIKNLSNDDVIPKGFKEFYDAFLRGAEKYG